MLYYFDVYPIKRVKLDNDRKIVFLKEPLIGALWEYNHYRLDIYTNKYRKWSEHNFIGNWGEEF